MTVSDPPNNLIKVWDLYTGQLVQVFHAPAPWLSFGPELVFSPDGKVVAARIMMTPPPREKAPTEPFPMHKSLGFAKWARIVFIALSKL